MFLLKISVVGAFNVLRDRNNLRCRAKYVELGLYFLQSALKFLLRWLWVELNF